MVKRIWQTGKSKDRMMIELYEPGAKPEDLSKEVADLRYQYNELGWEKIDIMVSLNEIHYMINTDRIILVLQKSGN